MADNLTVSIGADTSKLNAEIEKTQLLIKNFRREAGKALTRGDAAGVEAYTQQIGQLKASLPGLERQLAQTGDAAAATGRKFAVSARHLRSFDGAMMGVARNFGALGVSAFATFRIFSQIVEQIDEYRKKLLEIRDTAQETAQAPGAVKAAQDISKSLGRSAADADKMMSGVAESVAKFRTEAGRPINTHGVEVLNDRAKDVVSNFERGVQVLRAGERPVIDLQKAYSMLGIQANKYAGTQEGIRQKQLDTFAAFQRAAQQKIFDPVQLNEIAKVLFKGLPADAALQIIPGLLKQLREETEKNTPVIQADIKAEQDRLAAWAEVSKQLEAKIAEHNRLWTSVQIASANALNDFVKSLPGWVSAWEQWKEGNKAAIEGFFDWIGAKLAAMGRAISDAISAVRSLPGTLGGGDMPPMPPSNFAAGGMVRGPGTGTSDSIAARLSNGEFVMRAAAVRAWGLPLMARLNAMRSPVPPLSRGRRGFADGGLVTARTADGTVVNLHFPGGSFALRADQEIVGGLTREARRAGMLSAGRMAAALN